MVRDKLLLTPNSMTGMLCVGLYSSMPALQSHKMQDSDTRAA